MCVELGVNAVAENHCLFNYSLVQIVTCNVDDNASGKQVVDALHILTYACKIICRNKRLMLRLPRKSGITMLRDARINIYIYVLCMFFCSIILMPK